MTDPRTDLWTTTRTAGRTDRASTGAHAATAAASAPARRRGWLWLLLALVALLALVLGLVRCGTGEVRTDAPAVGAPAAGAPAADAPAAPEAGVPNAGAPDTAAGSAGTGAAVAGTPGSLLAGSASLFDAVRPGGPGLAPLVGRTAVARAVPVQSVPADEGFWVGTGATDRVWVQFRTTGESGVSITPGRLLDLSGTVVAHGAGFAATAGVPAQDGAAQLTAQGAHLEVDPSQVKVVAP